jgi:hypothetical protein
MGRGLVWVLGEACRGGYVIVRRTSILVCRNRAKSTLPEYDMAMYSKGRLA